MDDPDFLKEDAKTAKKKEKELAKSIKKAEEKEAKEKKYN